MTSCMDSMRDTQDDYSSDTSTARLKPLNNEDEDEQTEQSMSVIEHPSTIPLKPATSNSVYSGYLSNSSTGCGGDANTIMMNKKKKLTLLSQLFSRHANAIIHYTVYTTISFSAE